MKWIPFVLLSMAALVAAVDETHHLRQEKEPMTRETSRVLNFFSPPNFMYREHYRSGEKHIHDGGSSYCKKHDKCGECEGDCDDDDDCEPGLYCYQRDEKGHVPGCKGGSSEDSKSDFCVKKKHSDSTPSKSGSTAHKKSTSSKSSSTDKIKDKGSNYCSHHHPCKECYGDCDDDDDCEHGLICYQRDEKESVPGCSGGSSAKSKTDFCVKEKYGKKRSSSTDSRDDQKKIHIVGECSSNHKCDRCEGDCDSDSHCEGSLVCYHRNSKDDYVPGCYDEHKTSKDICVRHSDKYRRE